MKNAVMALSLVAWTLSAMAAAPIAVKYRSTSHVYLDAGAGAGLQVGDRVRVVAGATTVAELEVVYVAEQSASCKVLSESRPVKQGDAVVVVPRATGQTAAPNAGAPTSTSAPPAASTAGGTKPASGTPVDGGTAPTAASSSTAATTSSAATPGVVGATATSAPGSSVAGGSTAPTSPSTSAPKAGLAKDPAASAPFARLRGAASFGYYRSVDKTEWGLDFQERTARLDVTAYDIAGQPLTFTLRGRSRQDVRSRTLSARTPTSERADRLYEAALRYEPPSDDFSFELGRIGVSRFVSLGYLDGALGRYRVAGNLQLGLFGGKMADVDGIGFDGKGQKYGGFLRISPRGRYATGGFDALLAYVRENVSGDVSREYLSLESRFGAGSRWWLSERAELEINRGWREELTGKAFELSNVSVSLNGRLSPASWAFVSYDGRRNYRYFRNRIVPEEVFDDLLHQGLRAGVNMARAGGFGANVGLGMSLKGQDPRHPELNLANAYSGNAGVRHASAFGTGLSVGIDATGFTNGYTEGGLASARVGRLFASGHSLDLSYTRSLYHVLQTDENRTTQFLRLVGRASLSRRFYVLGDLEYDRGDDLEGPRAFVEVGVLF